MKLRTQGVTWQEIDGELVILDMKTSEYLTTNVAGAVLAKALAEEMTIEELAQKLVSNFDIDMAAARTDAQLFIGQLAEKQLLA